MIILLLFNRQPCSKTCTCGSTNNSKDYFLSEKLSDIRLTQFGLSGAESALRHDSSQSQVWLSILPPKGVFCVHNLVTLISGSITHGAAWSGRASWAWFILLKIIEVLENKSPLKWKNASWKPKQGKVCPCDSHLTSPLQVLDQHLRLNERGEENASLSPFCF